MIGRLAATLIIGLTACSALMPVASASDEVFGLLSGNWRGKGLIKTSADAKKESIRCRMRANNDQGANKLSLSGNCGVAGFVFSLNGWVQQNGNKNSYQASMFRSIVALKTELFSGKRRGNNLDFTYRGVDRTSNDPISAQIQVITKGENSFDVRISRTDPNTKKNFSVGTIKFSRK